MKNVEFVDDALNCTFDIFQFTDSEYLEVFPNGIDMEFIQDLLERLGKERVDLIMTKVWKRRIERANVNGVHGVLFYGEINYRKKSFFPLKKIAEPDAFGDY